MKVNAWIVKKGNLPYLLYSEEEAIRYHKHTGSKEPIIKIYFKPESRNKKTFNSWFKETWEILPLGGGERMVFSKEEWINSLREAWEAGSNQ